MPIINDVKFYPETKGLSIEWYQNSANRTSGGFKDTIEQLQLACLGIAGESGEFIDLIKKSIYHNKEVSKLHLLKELGDILWYVNLAVSALNLELEEVMVANIEKLEKRYPNGFNHHDANNRKD